MPKPNPNVVYYTDPEIVNRGLERISKWAHERSQNTTANGATSLSILRRKCFELHDEAVIAKPRTTNTSAGTDWSPTQEVKDDE